ncbi:hypothetical protein BCR35DRAFT_144601 [Leucosporidium creatinivorum]|uniref:Serine/threonine-protein phosphatase 2A activator n=1 Tax=Leucosporidium creatinivorum TaxID=106004 RepID=A0A1Y2ERB6_9BASI|nr:hypothetical protein BCR35DRAFT_144601 [Leucosporidium creatinivorum]
MSTSMPSPTASASTTALPPLPQLPAFNDYSLCAAPTRKIYTQDDIPAWVESETYHLIETIILRLSVAVDGKTVQDPCHEGQATKTLVDFLQKAESWVDDIPLQTSPQRFGNKAFREWIALLEKSERDLQHSLLTPTQHPIIPELSHHFVTSFGSPARLDYGTGHELSFLAYLLILRLTGTFTEQDEQAMVTRVFTAYLAVVRKLQKVFRLEPAGSKGVWGLDDHQHLVYLWGASQLPHPTVRPSSILAPQAISPLGISYLFLSSILHVNDLKTGPFAEHSPLLHNIASTVPNWTKVSTGLLKMYREEVLKKVPVVQHFWFGGVLGWRKATVNEQGNLVDPFQGPTMESSGDHLEEEDKEAVEQLDSVRERDEGTVAPWALPSLSGSGHNSPVRNNSAAPRSRHTSSTSSSSSSNGTPSHSTTGTPIPPRYSPSNPSPPPQPFVPPALFPLKRRGSLLGMGNGEQSAPATGGGMEGTVAEEGGAAAASSPFGVLGKASLGRS